ncbi:hypothetical protein E5344_12245 [Microbacterium laevaniformans]|uniref:Uncharacterized protein n=1 Tax=Microbacterium laevaniformans TaxID=36807 RepID=A0A4S2D107_9MICO|nr:hypothetical protein [Microbacterium laevaniformans]TGY35049.1 hypothetical protein E5344_12245 [Microbacterium laevaniformans]
MNTPTTDLVGRNVRIFPAITPGWTPISGVILAEDDVTILIEDRERNRQSVIPFSAIGRIELGSWVKEVAA